MKYKFYRIAPIDDNTPDPMQVYFDRMEAGSGVSEEADEKFAAEREKYRTYAFVKYKKEQKWGNCKVYGFLELDHPFPVNAFGGPGWSEMVVVI